jgi:hypothetical protein
MTMKMGHWALGLFTLGSAIVVSCGGSSEDGEGMNGTAGTSASSGSGGSATAGTGGTAGTGTSGSATGGIGGTTPAAGGDGPELPGGGGDGPSFPGAGGDGPTFPGAGGDGPTFPGAGGDGPTTTCPATQPTDGEACTVLGFVGCDYADITCTCRRMGGGQGQGMRTWDCGAEGAGGAGPGAGGAGPGLGNAECPADAVNDDECTGTGLCSGQQCFCVNGTVNCF